MGERADLYRQALDHDRAQREEIASLRAERDRASTWALLWKRLARRLLAKGRDYHQSLCDKMLELENEIDRSNAAESALSSAREEARALNERVKALDAWAVQYEELRKDYLSLLEERDAAREEARREREQADVWQSQLHDTAAALHLAKEEARRCEKGMFQARDIAAEHVSEESKLRRALAASESSARRLREALVDLLESVDVILGLAPAGTVAGDAIRGSLLGADERARAALGSSPGPDHE